MKLLERFAEALRARKVRLHSAVIISGGEVKEDIYFSSYTPETLTRMYSASKSVAAVAIGKLVGEGKLSLDTRVVDIFRDRFDMSGVDPLLAEQTVREMLTMTTCYSGPTYSIKRKDWLASYFEGKATHPANTVWYYDSSGSYVIGAITQHLTGKDFVEYLRPEFDIMGISKGIYSLKGPDGEAWASSGVMATITDLAKIAYLLLKGGKWGDKQLIPEEFARDAISPLKNNADTVAVHRFNVGYGYQIWSHPGGAFAFRGLGGQVAVGYPERDLVIACNSDTSANHNAYDDIFDVIESVILPEYPIIAGAVNTIKPLPDVPEGLPRELDGVRYNLSDNPMNISAITLLSKGDSYSFEYELEGEARSIAFKPGKEIEITFPEKYWGEMLLDEGGMINYRCRVESEWLEPRKLFIRVWAEDLYVGNMTIALAFRDDGMLGVKMEKSAQFFFDGFEGYATGRREVK